MAYTDRTKNSARQWVPSYATPVPITASVQMVPRVLYSENGLDLQKRYIRVYCEQHLLDVDRDTSSDQFIWNGGLYQIDSNNDWSVQDGWIMCLAVYIKRST